MSFSMSPIQDGDVELLPKPLIDSATEPFFAAAREGVLKVRRCVECHKLHWYPRPLCPYCYGDTQWETASGLGTLYSVTVTRRGKPKPFALAYVRLDEGVTLLSHVVDCELDALRIGQRLKVVFKPAQDGWTIPMFTPVGEAAA
jgi:uncharacterized OB-fold protein